MKKIRPGNRKKHLCMLLLSLTAVSVSAQPADGDAAARVREFIRDSWDRTVRFHTEDEGDRIGLPYRYTVPSVSGAFQEMYYWDTYFIGEGLIRDGRVDLARGNADDMLYMVDRFGKMYNGNLKVFSNRSQPPFLSMMVESVYRETRDKEWLRRVLPSLEKEYRFWMSERIAPVGLNRYGQSGTDGDKMSFVDMLKVRLGDRFRTDGLSRDELLQIGSNYIAEAESGWDFNPRFETRCLDFCPVDLNANLYRYEKNFEYFASELGDRPAARRWARAAKVRKTLIRKYCRDPESGMFYDYDYVNDKRSDVVSAAVFSLLYARAVGRKDAPGIVRALDRLEFPYGLAACENKEYPYAYQWSYPNGWAPLHFLAIRGLDNYGFRDEARRIAGKYVGTVVRNFDRTGNLWEKYNVVRGNIDVSNEYEMPTMIGWTAGVFIFADGYLHGRRPAAAPLRHEICPIPDESRMRIR